MAKRRLKLVVIGGGAAGLSAAWQLARLGAEVVLIERKKSLGGRAGSTVESRTGQIVEHVHVFLGIYENTLSWFRDLGTIDRLEFESSLSIHTLLPHGGKVVFSAARMPPPFDVVMGLLPLCVGLGEKIRLFRLAAILGPLYGLDRITIAMWLDRLKIPEAIRKYALEPIATSYLNLPTTRASAYPFAALLRKILFRGALRNAFGISRVSLEELYVRPAVDSICVRGGRVIRGVSATSLLVSGKGKVAGVALSNGTAVEGDGVISTVMPMDLTRITSNYAGLDRFTSVMSGFASSPTVTVNLWYGRRVMEESFAFVASPMFDRVFDVSGILQESKAKGQRLCLMRTSATDLITKKNSELIDLAREEVELLKGGTGVDSFSHGRVDREINATVALEPGTRAMRPGPKGPIGGFFLAGDWVRTGMPTNFESAVLSGIMAAREAMSA